MADICCPIAQAAFGALTHVIVGNVMLMKVCEGWGRTSELGRCMDGFFSEPTNDGKGDAGLHDSHINAKVVSLETMVIVLAEYHLKNVDTGAITTPKYYFLKIL